MILLKMGLKTDFYTMSKRAFIKTLFLGKNSSSEVFVRIIEYILIQKHVFLRKILS